MTFAPFPARRAAAALLLAGAALAGCKNTPSTADNQSSPVNESVANESALANAETGTEPAAEADAVTVADVPAPASGTSGSAAAPLMDAALIAQQIQRGSGVERVRHGDGWAWKRNGEILRTASADGRDVAYFRPGEDQPFLTQHGDRAYGYAGGKVTRSFDAKGRAQQPDASAEREAKSLADTAKHDRDEAGRSPAPDERQAGPRDRATPTPTPSPKADRNADRRGHEGERATMHDNPNTPTNESAGDHHR